MIMIVKLFSAISNGLQNGPVKFRISMVAIILSLVISLPAHAQSVANLKHELDRLKQDLTDMQRYVYQGKEPATVPNLEAGGAPSNISGQLQVQIQRLEDDVRKLNGRFEETGHQISTMEMRLDRLITDVDYRLRAIEGQLSGEPVVTGNVSNLQSDVIYPNQPANYSSNSVQTLAPAAGDPNSGTTIVSSQGTQIAPGGELLPGQQSLGQLTPEQMTAFANGEAPSQPQTSQTSSAPAVASVAPTSADMSAQELYDNAIALLSKRDYDNAELVLRQFLDENSDDPLAGNAMYWLGETYYARDNFRESTKVFAQAYTKYPEGAKVTASLLKLAMSLEAIDQIEVACTSYRTLLDEHKDARQRVLSIAEKAVVKLSCP